MIRVLPLGGLGEIGMNCMLFSVHPYKDWVMIDCGMTFPSLQVFGVDLAIPNFPAWKEYQSKIKAIILTHGHEDHIGALPFAFQEGIRAPVYGSPFTLKLVEKRLSEYGLEGHIQLHEVKNEDFFLELPRLKCRMVPVNHSIVDACALVFETPYGSVVHTGDFKIDPQPRFGKELSLEVFPKNPFLLLSDSTNIEHDIDGGDQEVYEGLGLELPKVQGRTYVTLFGSNIARMRQVLDIAKQLGKKVGLVGRTLETNLRLAQEYLKDDVICTIENLFKEPRSQQVILITGCQGESRSVLSKIAHKMHPELSIEPGDGLIYSARMIPGNEKAITALFNLWIKQGARIVKSQTQKCCVHVSGHATRTELKRIIQELQPKWHVPIHGEYRHLKAHQELAESLNTTSCIVENTQLVEFSHDFRLVEQRDVKPLLVSKFGHPYVSRKVLKERRILAESGVALALASKSGIMQGEENALTLYQRGIVDPSLEDRWVTEIIENFYSQNDHSDIMEKLRRHIKKTTRQKYNIHEPVLFSRLED